MESRFNRISNLANKKTNSKIKVRLTILWKSINGTTGDFKGYNMILLDDDKTHIHAFAGLEFVNGIDFVPQEGKVYSISNFSVDNSDLIGLVQNRLPMQSRNTQTGPKDVLLFDISDGSSTVKVTVWADLAHKLNEELDGMLGQDNIIIITSCGITEYHEQLQASTLSPSKFYINPDYDAVNNLRYRLNVMNEPIALDDKFPAGDCAVNKTPVYNLKEIMDLRNSELKEMDVICHVSICSVEEQSKWWFYVCDSCPNEVCVKDDNYKCECGKIGSYPDKRFKPHWSKSKGRERRPITFIRSWYLSLLTMTVLLTIHQS
ncbi:hypothetical protein POM88_044251 [Heracleum sosnowskyi]|uniref:Replication protein A OB domain-containing protein n=1 Tax=Heracleum sosnowskyi TaxID=360622 RepID=A0AAD8M540_9APIA|nr:hypothetical protein POM88_044251 [Heracleum sosnowskyi]